MTSVARPPRRPSTLAIRSLWPVHVPTRDTESAASSGVETRMANAAEYKSAFMWSLHASIHKESHSRCKDGVTNVPARREYTAAEDVSVARWRSSAPDRPRVAGASRREDCTIGAGWQTSEAARAHATAAWSAPCRIRGGWPAKGACSATPYDLAPRPCRPYSH